MTQGDASTHIEIDRALSTFKQKTRNMLAPFQLDEAQIIPHLKLECTYPV